MGPGDLWQYFLTNPGYVICKLPHYFPIYERHFAKFRGEPITVIEIGVAGGGSLQMWQAYFGSRARVVGIDCNPACAARSGIEVFIGDQADSAFLQSVITTVGPPTIVIDDGSHRGLDTRATFDFLYPRVTERGVYLVEDLHTAYDPAFGPRDTAFTEVCKGMVDSIHGAYHSSDSLTPITRSMHIYDSIAVFEKGPRRVLPLTYSWGTDYPLPERE